MKPNEVILHRGRTRPRGGRRSRLRVQSQRFRYRAHRQRTAMNDDGLFEGEGSLAIRTALRPASAKSCTSSAHPDIRQDSGTRDFNSQVSGELAISGRLTSFPFGRVPLANVIRVRSHKRELAHIEICTSGTRANRALTGHLQNRN